MYYYIYDQFLNDKKYQQTIAKIENRLTDLEIRGKTGKLSLLNNMEEMISKEINNGIKTIVVIGNDLTVSKVIKILNSYPDVCLGIIPVGPGQKIAHTLGIPDGLSACNVLASRIIKKIDLGKIKNKYFLSQVEIRGKNVILECDEKYTVEIKNSNIFIFNFNYWSDNHLANPGDGKLEIVITKKNNNFFSKMLKKTKSKSFFLAKKIKVFQNEEASLAIIDEQQKIKTPFLVEIAKHQLKVIVGKERNFNLK